MVVRKQDEVMIDLQLSLVWYPGGGTSGLDGSLYALKDLGEIWKSQCRQ